MGSTQSVVIEAVTAHYQGSEILHLTHFLSVFMFSQKARNDVDFNPVLPEINNVDCAVIPCAYQKWFIAFEAIKIGIT